MSEELLDHTEWVRRLARSLAGDDATADDLVQETWIAARRRPPDLDRPVRPWLAVVVRNLFLKRRARERRREARHHQIAAHPDAVAPPSPEATLESAQVQRLLAELVAALDEPYRQTLVLHYFEDQSAADIARAMGIPAGTVRWRLKVARDELRQGLDRRHAGQREVWRRALLPLSPVSAPRAPGARLDRAPLAVGVVGLVIAVSFTRACVREPTSTVLRSGDPRAVSPPASSTGAVPLPGGPTLDRDQCLAAVIRLRAETETAERERLLKLDPEERFELGEANPVAQQEIAPVITRILAGEKTAAPSHTLECKTWGCRVLLLSTAEELAAEAGWQHRLRDDQEASERLDSFSLSTAAPTKDPVSKLPLYEQPIFLALADPSGRRLPRPREELPAIAPATPLPSTLDSCRRELALLRGRLTLARDANRALERQVGAQGKDWTGVVERRSKELEAQGVSEACAARFPGRGTLEVRFELYGTRNEESARPRLVARYGGPLAGTPLGQCLADNVVEPILSTPLPEPPLAEGVAYYPIVIR